MPNKKRSIFTFIVIFRGGTYCSQVQAEDISKSISAWLTQIEKEQEQIKYLGVKGLEDLKKEAKDKNNGISPLEGLKNTWFTYYSTRQGSFFINIVKTAG